MSSKRQEGAWWAHQATHKKIEQLLFTHIDVKSLAYFYHLNKLEAGVEKGGLQQGLDAGDPHG